ncbi:DUF6596 domain-containing protein [Kribbella solani]|uniref:DUF6596 domain-containing protein n=1 Tax=Kribbella solani TaxID=236067 RepID=UPI003080DD34
MLNESRRSTRADDRNQLIQLQDQDRTHWDRSLITEGTALIESVWSDGETGPYQLQAAIAALHAQAATDADTDWPPTKWNAATYWTAPANNRQPPDHQRAPHQPALTAGLRGLPRGLLAGL